MNEVGKRNGMVRRIWLLIATEGGNWTPEEVSKELNVPRQIANRALHSMATDRGLLVRSKVSERAKFGVTETCCIPHGVTVREMLGTGLKGNQ